MKLLVPLLVLIIAAVIVVPQALYTVDETQFVVVTRFGEIQTVVRSPGLKVKAPFVDTANVLDKRILRIDVTPTSMPDQDNQFLEVDAYVRYRIADPRQFIERLRTESGANATIQQIVIAALRDEIGRSTQPQIIGGRLTGIEEDRTVVEPLVNEQGIPTRAAIVARALITANEVVKSENFGVDIVDIRIKRADFPDATQENIFTRMRTERSVQSQALRAEGEELYRERIANVDRQVEIIAAQADETADQLRGEGEGEAISILAEALEQDPEFFAFRRSLEAYRTVLGAQTTLVLPANSDLFRYLQSSTGTASGGDADGLGDLLGLVGSLFGEGEFSMMEDLDTTGSDGGS
jgi:membrane protease subunit HflC